MIVQNKVKMSDIGNYISMLFGKILSLGGAVFTFASIILFFFGNKILPETIPSFFLGILLFMLTLIGCGFAVWLDQLNLTRKADRQLREIRSRTPIFELDSFEVIKYSVSDAILELENRLIELKTQRDRKKQNVEDSSTHAPYGVFAAIESMKQSINFASIQAFSDETEDEKIAGINSHLSRLKDFEEKIASIYKVCPKFKSSIAAKNIEITMSVSAEKPVKIFLEDDYVADHIPRSKRRSSQYIQPMELGKINSGEYSLSFIDKFNANSGVIKHINSGVSKNIFDQELYVITEVDEVILEFSFICNERTKSQSITKTLSFEDFSLEKLNISER